jgi:hypothetical protein
LVVLGLILGIFPALVLVYLARRYPPQREKRFYAVGLLVAAVIYLIFGIVGGTNGLWLLFETFGVLIYGAVAWIGLRRWSLLLAFGWIAHVGWDMFLHVSGPGAEYTPDWYPWFCVSFDLIVAVAVLVNSRKPI